MHKKLITCDLIDLNSPDRKGFRGCRLASPLIPVPTDAAESNCNSHVDKTSSLVTVKRDSLENNPFDMVLHKTTEYIQKKDDPFEVVLEKALKSKHKKGASSRTCSIDFTDDYILKRRKKSQKLKMNRTLDESWINEELSPKNMPDNKMSNVGITFGSNKFDIQIDHLKPTNISADLSVSKSKCVIPTIQVQDTDLSILNQSVMNDTLFEIQSDTCNDNQDNILMNLKEDVYTIGHIQTASTLLPKLRRSFSQGENILPKRSQCLDRISVIESVQTEYENKNSTSSSPDFLNEGFLKSGSIGSSIFTSISSISSIAQSSNSPSIINTSLILSNGTLNRTFLESCSSDKSNTTKINSSKEVRSTSLTTNGLIKPVTNISNKTRASISDLTDRLNKLKTKASEYHVPEIITDKETETISSLSNDIKESVTVMENNEKCDTNNKLIDVDLFSPGSNCSSHQCRNSISDTSSDSVFLDEDKVNKSILHEAKILARTFEEMALKTSSGSSTDDLISNNPLWTSELLPAFDDEVDNLIELPTSPNINNVNSSHEKVTHCKDSVLHENTNDNVKDLEKELIDPISTEKRVTAATLLLDLKELINTENNTEANKLLENLERALGISWESNTELLSTYLNLTNNLAKSPQKLNNDLEMKNVTETTIEHSLDTNVTGDLSENIKELGTNLNGNDSSLDKFSVNSQKCLKEIDNELNDRLRNDNEKTKIENENEDSNAQNTNTEGTTRRVESNNSVNENVVMDLLTNIGKLLIGQPQEYATVDFLKKFGDVLHLVSGNINVNENIKTNTNDVEIVQISKGSKLKYENKANSSVLSKSVNRLSLQMESKKQSTGKPSPKRSTSISQILPVKTIPSPLLCQRKSTNQLKDVAKRFSSDPGFISLVTNQKVITNDNKFKSVQDVEIKSDTNLEKEKTAVVGTVKSRLKKKVGGDVINKKGPMKATLPIGNMQKKESFNKNMNSTTDTTPPNAHKIISSTPNPTVTRNIVKKPTRPLKPVASSTPDAQNSKTRRLPSHTSNNTNKRNSTCDVSPVTTRLNVSNSDGVNSSPKRTGKIPSSRNTTPKRRSVDSSIPRSQTPPVNKKLNSSLNVSHHERLIESPQRSSYKVSNSQKNSPISLRRNGNNTQQSPLRDNNKLAHKVKPVNLISKIRRHSVGNNVMEKENAYI
ncbi:uncharacterized protein LOC117223252 [Megalopta genalis]|uniref:uncharacterized protein LOC117223252 n=1 Tax=Megalopta genalis TaxID=115081 RepID=UPI003FD5F936